MKRLSLLIILSLLVVACSQASADYGSPELQASSSNNITSFNDTSTSTPFLPAATTTFVPSRSAPIRVVAYYPYWQFSNYPPAKLPAENIDVINYEFALPTSTGDCFLENLKANHSVIASLLSLKDQNPKLRVMLSIGGVNSANYFATATANPELTKHFAESCVQAVDDNNFDGIDINWEFSNSGQAATFFDLLTSMRKQLDDLGKANKQHYLMTIAASADADVDDMSADEIAKVISSLDWVNLMTFDFYDSTSRTTGLTAPLYNDPDDDQQQSVDSVVQKYINAGLPPDKLFLGISFSGHSWQGVQDNNNGLYQPFSGTPEGSDRGIYSYSQIKELFLDSATRYWDDASKAPWLYDSSKGVMVSYEDAESVGFKAAYARDHGLGGVMISEITADDADNTLLAPISDARR